MKAVRLVAIGWMLHLRMISRSAFDGLLAIVYPLFFATSVFFIYGQGASEGELVTAAVGATAPVGLEARDVARYGQVNIRQTPLRAQIALNWAY